MAYDSQSSKWSTIANAIALQLVTVTELDTACIRIVASDQYQNYIPSVGDRVLLLRYFGPEPSGDAGVGRRARDWKRLVRIYLFTRDSSDLAGEDVTGLFKDGGHSDFEEQVIDALDEHWPKDEDGVVLTIEPLHPLNSAEGPPVRKPEDDLGWLTSHLDFECHYVGRTSNPQP